jgi:hypothetical protein
MSVASVRTPADYEERLARYLFERSEEGRAVRVGEKEVSEQAAIVERFRDLFSAAQVDVLRAAEESASGDERELLYRLRKTCESGIIAAELAAREDELENRILAARVNWRGEEMPLRNAQAKLAVLTRYGDRDELGSLANAVSAGFNDDRRELLAAGEELEAELSGEPDPVARNAEEKGISLQELERVLDAASRASAGAYDDLRGRWFEKLLGPEREEIPTSNHTSYLRRVSPLDQTYTKEQAVPVCVASLAALGLDLDRMPGIRLDLDDRPQKSPRACVIASDPPNVVHLITRAQGGLHDYQAFLHEAGHALHYAGVDPELPYTFRKLSRDHALTEIYCTSSRRSRESRLARRALRLSDDQAPENAEATVFLEALSSAATPAKLQFELELLGAASVRTAAPRAGTPNGSPAAGHSLSGGELPVRHGTSGFYSAGYLRAWIRSAQARQSSRREVGVNWWRKPRDGGIACGTCSVEGTRPTSRGKDRGEVGYEPLGHRPAPDELGASPPASFRLDAVRLSSYRTPESGLRFGPGHSFSSHGGQGDARKALEERRNARGCDDGPRGLCERGAGTPREQHRHVRRSRLQGRDRLLAHGPARCLRRRVHPGPPLRARVCDQGHDEGQRPLDRADRRRRRHRPDEGRRRRQGLIGKGYKILAGSVSSGVALQMAPLAEQNKVLFISGPAASMPSPGSTSTRSAPAARPTRT